MKTKDAHRLLLMTIALVLVVGMASPAYATITSGSVTGGSSQAAGGNFIKVVPPIPGPSGICPPNSVGNNCQQTHDLWGFDEDQNIILGAPLLVDDVAGTGSPYTSSNLPVATTVASHYVYYDPGPTNTIQGCVNFDSNVVGVIFLTNTLFASDFLANTGVNYLNPGLRGLEIPNQDSVTFSGNQVCVDFLASTPGDYFRVLTEFSPGGERVIGGEIIPINTTSLLLAGVQTNLAWIIPVVFSAVGIGIFLVKKKF